MKAANFLRILAVSLALSGYSAWSLTTRDRQPFEPPRGQRMAADIPLINRDQAESLWRQGGTLFVDVRSSADYQFGHIRGAVSLPYEELDLRMPELKGRLSRARTIVVYCKSIDCGKSLWGALRLRQEGLDQTVIYPEGWNEWVDADLPRTHSGK
jgi:rhodanese-related sulfurtransferase